MIKNNALLACFLVTVFNCLSCSSSPEARKTVNEGPTVSVGTQTQSDIENALLQNERKIWEAFKARDAKSADALLAEEVLIVTPDGRFTKSEFMKLIPQFPDIPSYSIDNAKIILPTKEIAVLTYDSRYVTKEPEPRTHLSYQTTVWINRGGKWMAIFNQETQVPPR